MTIGYSIAVLMWVIDMIWDNKGGSIHFIFWWTTQLLPILPALLLIFIPLANRSYGTRTQVFNSWFGGDLQTSDGGYSTAPAPAGWTHDAKYILWKDYSAALIPTNNYNLIANLAKNGADTKRLGILGTTLFAAIVDIILIYTCWEPFAAYYHLR